MNRMLFVAPLVALAGVAVAAPTPKASHMHKAAPAVGAAPKMENQFGTVDEFTHKKFGSKVAASVEGYAVMGGPAAGGERVYLTDSVDHVLSAKDADGAAASGMVGVIPASALQSHPHWAWSSKGIQPYVMYSGSAHAGKAMHDTVAKMRLTGWASGKTLTVTKVEVQDDNGNWKSL